MNKQYMAKMRREPTAVQFWTHQIPKTPDTLEYDVFAHHIAFRSVLGSLVSQYRIGQFVGMAADKWEISDDQKIWSFHLRPGGCFDNGDLITPEIVRRSFVRLGYMLQKKDRNRICSIY